MSAFGFDRVTYVSGDSGVPVFGRKGCSVHVREILRAFARRGVRTRLVARRLGGDVPTDLQGLAVLKLAPARRERASGREPETWNPALAAILRGDATPDLVYERHSIWSWGAMEWAASYDIPSVLEINAPLIDEQERYRRLEDRAAAERATRRCVESAGTIVAVSERVADYAYDFGARPEQVRVIPNGVDLGRFPDRHSSEDPRENATFTVGFVGTLKPWHGLSMLAVAFSSLLRTHPRARLLVVGDGPARSQFERELEARGALASTDFTGSVDSEQIPSLLDRMDVGVAPYPAQDEAGFYFSPLKILEYMAAGLPVVASAIGQIPRLVAHDREGYLSAAGDDVGLAQAIRVLADSPGTRLRMGKAGRDRAIRSHSWDAVLDRTLSPSPAVSASSVVS